MTDVCNCGHDLLRHNGFNGDGEPFHCVDCDCKAFKRHAGKLDIEPTWMQILGMVEKEVVPVRELEMACVLADRVRQAQKKGESITIHPDNSVVIDDHEDDESKEVKE